MADQDTEGNRRKTPQAIDDDVEGNRMKTPQAVEDDDVEGNRFLK